MKITILKIANLTYRCNGKELEDRIEGFHFYDYGARFYEPALARWHSVDPLAEKGRQWSPYTYVFNNPMNFTDPDGRWGRLTNWVRFAVNWLGLNGNENDEKRELPKDELASNKNISKEDIAYTIMLDDVPVERSSDGDDRSLYQKYIVDAKYSLSAKVDFSMGLKYTYKNTDIINASIVTVGLFESGYTKEKESKTLSADTYLLGLGNLKDHRPYRVRTIAKMQGPALNVLNLGLQSTEYEINGNGKAVNIKGGNMSVSYKNSKYTPSTNTFETGFSGGELFIWGINFKAEF